jgi:hypothetical protein
LYVGTKTLICGVAVVSMIIVKLNHCLQYVTIQDNYLTDN